MNNFDICWINNALLNNTVIKLTEQFIEKRRKVILFTDGNLVRIESIKKNRDGDYNVLFIFTKSLIKFNIKVLENGKSWMYGEQVFENYDTSSQEKYILVYSRDGSIVAEKLYSLDQVVKSLNIEKIYESDKFTIIKNDDILVNEDVFELKCVYSWTLKK